jgi:hypothetical protein
MNSKHRSPPVFHSFHKSSFEAINMQISQQRGEKAKKWSGLLLSGAVESPNEEGDKTKLN